MGNRIPSPPRPLKLSVGEQQWFQSLAHVPLYVVGEHTQKQMRSYMILTVVPNWADQDLQPLQGPVHPFHPREVAVLPHRFHGR